MMEFIQIRLLLLLVTQLPWTSSVKAFVSHDFERNNNLRGNWAFSPIMTRGLARFEMKVQKLILDYKTDLKDKLDTVDRWINDYEVSSFRNSDVLSQNTSNNNEKLAELKSEQPIMGYRMILRCARNLSHIKQVLSTSDTENRFIQTMNEFSRIFSLPRREDVSDVMANIIKLQEVYDLRASDLMNGTITKVHTTAVGISMEQAFEIGRFALASQAYTVAWDWFQSLLHDVKNGSDKTGQISESEIRDKLRRLVEEHDMLHNEINDENYYHLNLKRFHSKIVSEYELMTAKAAQVYFFRDSRIMLDSFAFMVLCNGDNFMSETEKSKLICYYERNLHPFWVINPLKIEVHDWDLHLIRIYDVIGNKLINYLKNNAIPALQRSGVYNENSGANSISDYRTSSQTFLRANEYPPAKHLEKLIGSMTGLQVENKIQPCVDNSYASEEIQIAAYTIGTFYAEHFDSFQGNKNETPAGDRIATFMIYLNDVQLGGHTAFPKIGTSIVPVKGSAVFWYNSMRNGTVDTRSLHGGCPVIIGQKWIANKWIRTNANFQKRKCSLNPLE